MMRRTIPSQEEILFEDIFFFQMKDWGRKSSTHKRVKTISSGKAQGPELQLRNLRTSTSSKRCICRLFLLVLLNLREEESKQNARKHPNSRSEIYIYIYGIGTSSQMRACSLTLNANIYEN
jgi:hypothetical protein